MSSRYLLLRTRAEFILCLCITYGRWAPACYECCNVAIQPVCVVTITTTITRIYLPLFSRFSPYYYIITLLDYIITLLANFIAMQVQHSYTGNSSTNTVVELYLLAFSRSSTTEARVKILGVDEGNLQVVDVEMITDNCPITTPTEYTCK